MQDETEKPQRTLTQNNAIHKYLGLVAKQMKDSGKTFNVTLPNIEIPWSKEAAKLIWHAIQESMFGTSSTKDLTTDQVSEVYEVYNEYLASQSQPHIPFPSIEEIMMKDLLEKN